MRPVLVAVVTVLTPLAAFAQGDIRSVDFNNFTYEVEFCQTEASNKITVSNGEFYEEKEVDGYTDRRFFSVSGFTYGDLDGDGKDEAVVISVCNTGGTGNFTEAYVFTWRGGEAKRIVTLEGGDRAYGGLREIRIVDRKMIVEASDPGEMGGACCPEEVVTRTYRLKGNSLEEIGKPERRELFPASRVAFEKGASSATLEIELGDDPGIRRFVIGASKGQTLTVKADLENVRFRLIKGEAEIEEESKTLLAELLEDGDFVFEIRNFGEGDLKTKMIVTIR
ncbi:MAG: hypothetical protein IPM63_01050 [Acidobacteriota bacterium]|nr:MAG: hypothetical protein IPM63_01050 [Acidobacteriota bacterium]